MHSTSIRRAGGSLASLLYSPSPRPVPRRVRTPVKSSADRHIRPRFASTFTPRPAAAPANNAVAAKPPATPVSSPAPPTPSVVKPQTAVPEPIESADVIHRSLTEGLSDPPPFLGEDEKQVDWTRSFHGLSSIPFTPEQAEILMAPIPADDVEVKPDGIIYLPEIKYRRILNRAFGPGAWGLAPRGETIVTQKLVTREYGLVVQGRLVSISRGEQQYFDPDGIPTATEGCKSNALMRCCKDLGIASELWDPRFIRKFMAKEARELMVEHVTTKKRRKHYMRKDDALRYPWKEVPTGAPGPAVGGFKK